MKGSGQAADQKTPGDTKVQEQNRAEKIRV